MSLGSADQTVDWVPGAGGAEPESNNICKYNFWGVCFNPHRIQSGRGLVK